MGRNHERLLARWGMGLALLLAVLIMVRLPASAAAAEGRASSGPAASTRRRPWPVDPAGNAYVVGETFGTLPGQKSGGNDRRLCVEVLPHR